MHLHGQGRGRTEKLTRCWEEERLRRKGGLRTGVALLKCTLRCASKRRGTIEICFELRGRTIVDGVIIHYYRFAGVYVYCFKTCLLHGSEVNYYKEANVGVMQGLLSRYMLDEPTSLYN